MDAKEIEEIETELKVLKIPKLDLSKFVKIKLKSPEMRIGVLNAKIDGLIGYKKGDMVLFTPYTVEESYGKMLWDEMERHVKLCTIEIPRDEYFKEEKGVRTWKCIVGVPLSYIEYEIVI